MAVFHPHTVQCACGNAITVQLAESLNVRRSPEVRNNILKGQLHRASCPSCGRQMTIEKPFYYTDLDRNVIFKVSPRGERHLWKNASAELDKASSYVPAAITDSPNRTLRTVFGMDELREKLVAQDLKLDDRVVELLKVLVVYEHPILVNRPRLRLTLHGFTDADVEFNAAYEHSPQRFCVRMPRRIVDDLTKDPRKLERWTADSHRQDLFNLPDHWVNMWRRSPQPSALDQLRAYATQAAAGNPVATASADFPQMLAALPRGSHLPAWAKQDLRTLFEYAKKNNLQSLEDALFEIRFGIELEDDWSTNDDTEDIDTLWKLLKNLPDTNVEGNTKIHEILLDIGQGGGLYDPSSNDITIGSTELAHQERFEDVVRHEVGHAVQEMRDDLITPWLTQRFGWRVFDTSAADIDQWVALMGGWGTLTPSQREDVRGAIRVALGGGSSWSPGPTPALPAGHPWYKADFGPRLAFEKTGPSWYLNFQSWHRTNGKAFYLNYWYRTLMVVDTTTLDLVAHMPSNYASMSHFEFFAELYALYYDLDDPLHGNIPADVSQWIDQNVGAPEIAAPSAADGRAKREWETISRPKRPPAKKPRRT